LALVCFLTLVGPILLLPDVLLECVENWRSSCDLEKRL